MPRKQIDQRIMVPYNTKFHVWEDCGKICAHCGKPVMIGANFRLEHVIPLHKGGRNDPKNYVSLCVDCNEAKSDNVIEPLDYYPYLPKEKKAELQELFDEYLKSTKWLARDNVFVTDCFNISVPCPIPKPRSNAVVFMPATMRVERITSTEAFQFLYPYTARLRTEDKALMVHSEDAINTPYYKLLHLGKPLMYFSAYIDTPTWENEEKNKNSAVQLRVFANPELKEKKQFTDIMLANAVETIVNQIQQSLIGIQRGSTIECQILTPASDKYMARAMTALRRILKKHAASIEMSDNPDDPGTAKAIGVNMILFQGSYDDLIQLAKTNGYDSTKDFCQRQLTGDMQQDIEDELEKGVRFKDRHIKPHKNDIKKFSRNRKKKPNNKYNRKRT